VEVHNDHGVVVTRAAVSARIPRGICIQYHSPERTYSVPKSPLRNYRRAGGHNSLTRVTQWDTVVMIASALGVAWCIGAARGSPAPC
jgi:nitrate reductase alpha subunit